jgi:HPt (histidine-containing phosphotransfer) domain-containing protein
MGAAMSDGRPRILVVVGDDGCRQGWCAALAEAGFLVEGVAGPPPAIQAARRPGGPPPVLLAVEAGLKGMGPLLLARALRSLPGLGGLPLLLLGEGPPAGLERSASAATLATAGAAAHALLAACVAGGAAPVAPPEKPVLDLVAVARVRAYGEPMFQQLVGQYLDDLPQRLDQIGQALVRGDLKDAGGIAHSLKGSSGSLGMSRLWQACSALESDCRDGRDAVPALAVVRIQAAAAAGAMRAVLAAPPAEA